MHVRMTLHSHYLLRKITMKKSIVLGSLLISAMSWSQNMKSGKIIDELTSNPIAGAKVTIDGKKTVLTNENGYFSFECAQGLKIAVEAEDYKPNMKTVSNCDEALTIPMSVRNVQIVDEINVTAHANSDKNKLYLPSSIATLNVNEIKRGNGLFMDDAINTNIPGVYMQRRTVSAGQTFNIRGYGNGIRGTNGMNSNFDSQGTKVYLNGIAITDAEGITLMDDIDFGSIGNVEVLKGPAGSLYGLAIAGAVNLTTMKPQAGKISIGQDVMMGSYGLKRYTTNLSIGTAKSSLLVNYGKQSYDGFMKHTASTKDFVNVFGTFEANERQSVNVYFGYSNSYDERNGELTKGQYDTLDYSGNPAYIKNNAHSNVISARAGFGHTYRLTKNLSNTTTVFATGISSNVSSAGGWTDKLPVNYGTRSTFDYKRKLNENFALSGVTGIEAQRQNSQSIGYGMVKDSNNVNNPYNIIGAMKSNTYSISKTYSYFTEWSLKMPYEMSLTAGVGVSNMSIELNDRFYVASNNNPSAANHTTKPSVYANSFNNLVSPHVALNKVFNKQISVYASYGTGYKAPVSSYFYIPLTGELNTNLKPEKGTQMEIGTKGNLLNKRLSYEVAAFHTVYTNKMTVVAVPNAAGTATAYNYVVNGGGQVNNGLEATLRVNLIQSEIGVVSNLTPFFNATYSQFQYKNFTYLNSDYSGKKVAGVPPLTLNAGFDLATKYGVYANMTYSYRDSVYYTSDNLNRANSYSLVNGKIGYRKVFANHYSVDAYFGANNITSQQYYVMLFVNQTPDVYLPGPSKINFFGGINFKYIF